MYLMIGNIIGEKRINLAYLIWGTKVSTVSMFSGNIQYQIKESLRVPLSKDEKQLPEGVFKERKLNLSIGKKVITLLDLYDNITKTNKLAGVTEIAIRLDELDNADNLENRRLSNVLLIYVTANEAFTNSEPVAPQYKKLKNGELTSLTLRTKDQKNNSVTDDPGMTIVLHIT